jgi:hypothetical protein
MSFWLQKETVEKINSILAQITDLPETIDLEKDNQVLVKDESAAYRRISTERMPLGAFKAADGTQYILYNK